ncbi:hypothetical protein NN561_018151 [Cricetulus griseus]
MLVVRCHPSATWAPPRHPPPPGQQAPAHDPEVKPPPEVPPPSSPRPRADGPVLLCRPLPGCVRTWDRGERFSVAGAGDAGARGRTSEDRRAACSPGARGVRGPAPRPSRLTQIAEAPGEEPLAARGSRLLPPALVGPPPAFHRRECRAPRSVPQAAAPSPRRLSVPRLLFTAGNPEPRGASRRPPPPPPSVSLGRSLPPVASMSPRRP